MRPPFLTSPSTPREASTSTPAEKYPVVRSYRVALISAGAKKSLTRLRPSPSYFGSHAKSGSRLTPLLRPDPELLGFRHALDEHQPAQVFKRVEIAGRFGDCA